MEKIKIEFYRKNVWGNETEYVKNPAQAQLIERLVGRKTVNGSIRELFRDLTGGKIEFVEVIAP